MVTGALAAGVLGTTAPAQASTLAPTTVTTAAVVTPAVVPTVLTPAQVAARKAAAARAAAAMRATRARVTAVSVARSKIGSRYSAGHAGPTRFDCSGLALYVVKKATGRTLPHYSKSQYRATKRVSRTSLRPGDLVFFFRKGAHHVGIYIGHGRMVSATNPRSGVKIDSVFSGWYGSRYSGAGRLV
jgi:cell wall-associated NlpC family hydrolase